MNERPNSTIYNTPISKSFSTSKNNPKSIIESNLKPNSIPTHNNHLQKRIPLGELLLLNTQPSNNNLAPTISSNPKNHPIHQDDTREIAKFFNFNVNQSSVHQNSNQNNKHDSSGVFVHKRQRTKSVPNIYPFGQT